MYKSFLTQSCVSRRMARKPAFAVVYTLLSLMISLCLACATRSEAGAPCPVIEVSAVADTSRTPLVATGDITDATASQANEQWVLDFTVTDAAANRVHEFSKQRVGTELAFVVDGRVHGTPRIAGAIVGNRYRIEGFDRADAERLATAIHNGCRR